MGTQSSDIVTILGKGLVGAIPFVGPLASEIIGSIIPNQRIDRIEALLKSLEIKITASAEGDKEKIQQRITQSESVDLVEDGFIQASRALSEQRIEYIASILKNSLTDEDLEHIEYKRLLSLLSQLNDLEVLILKSQTFYPGQAGYEAFWAAHEDALTPPAALLNSSPQEIDKYTLFQTHNRHLANLDLLRIEFKKPNRNEMPELDLKTGMIKAQGYDITALGRLLLRVIE